MYEQIRAKIEKYQEEVLQEYDTYIEGKTVGEILSHNFLRSLTTKTTLKQLQESDPSKPPQREVLDKMRAKNKRLKEKFLQKYYEKLKEAEICTAPNQIDIQVEFKRHPIWNYNPTVVVTCTGDITKGHASGCGYDKESAAIADAMNKNPQIMKALYDFAEQGGEFPYGVYTFAGVPCFMGGVGVNCFRNVFEACGYTWEDVYYGNHERAYRVKKGTI